MQKLATLVLVALALAAGCSSADDGGSHVTASEPLSCDTNADCTYGRSTSDIQSVDDCDCWTCNDLILMNTDTAATHRAPYQQHCAQDEAIRCPSLPIDCVPAPLPVCTKYRCQAGAP